MDTKNSLPPEFDPELFKQALEDPDVFAEVARSSFLYFFLFFFGEYVEYPLAAFHMDMFRIGQDKDLKRAIFIAFRSAAKSSILNTAYIIWSIVGAHQQKHIVIASQTQFQAEDSLDKIKKVIESNELLRKFFGPFNEGRDRWNKRTAFVPAYKARISTASLGQEGLRGMREGPHRPDLIILDDIEDEKNTKTRELRDKTFQWITGELLTIGDINTKVVFLGNFFNDDCALMRIGKLMQEGKMDGEFHKVPLVDDLGTIAWPGKYPSIEKVEEHRRSIGDNIRWFREFLLKYVPEDYQPVKPEHIQYYDVDLMLKQLKNPELAGTMAHGLDPAFGTHEHNDRTAIVTGVTRFESFEKEGKLYILPDPINKQWNVPQMIEYGKNMSHAHHRFSHLFYIEAVQGQVMIVEEFKRSGLWAVPMQALGTKLGRLQIAAIHIINGTVVFPNKGCEELLDQLFNFGLAGHDDLVDALVYLILGIINDGRLRMSGIQWL